MVSSKRPFLADEELGKKDDDHRPQKRKHHLWRSSKQWKLPRPRRFLLGIIVLYLLYVFFKNMPTDLSPATERFNPALAEARQRAGIGRPPSVPSPAIAHHGPPPRDEFAPEGSLYYEGQIYFHALSQTLYRFRKLPSAYGLPVSRAVVFVGASLRSISDLLPLACRMAHQRVNEVHLVLMGRDDVSIGGIQRVNGIDDNGCPVHWHDARADYAQWSTDARMERAVASGLSYVQAYLSPQAIITQGESLEEAFVLQGIERRVRELGTTHIALPTATRNLMWISSLDSHSLKAWNNVHIEILIQAPPESSGSLIRLIRSLEGADYLGSVPSLTIELPHRVDAQLLRFLQTMNWPPDTSNKVTLRRRIRSDNINAAEASLRTVEAFYPRDPDKSHVLMLSPQTEIAASFFHYLKYTVLKYRYSATAKQKASDLLGISLELPSSLPTEGKSFTPPAADSTSSTEDGEALPIFLWQAPNSNAALYFGDKWAEFHSFLSDRLTVEEAPDGALLNDNLISERYPSVMEYLLELMRTRGYHLLYPAFPARGTNALVTIHTDLYQYPEEFSREGSAKLTGPESIDEHSKPLAAVSVENSRFTEQLLSQTSTLSSLLDQFSLDLPELDNLPLLSYGGEEVTRAALITDSMEYLRQFRVRYGGCPQNESEDASSTSLFCASN
ncbi:hypothetical protein BBP40_001844 [Aspergillus hancockii]|nr:hypothetical protein BBP40_001844 [Aspergillus hancockii]